MAADSERAGGRLLLVEQLVRLFLNQFVGVSKTYLPGSHVHQSWSHDSVSELRHMWVEGDSVGYPNLQIVTDDIPGRIALERFVIQALIISWSHTVSVCVDSGILRFHYPEHKFCGRGGLIAVLGHYHAFAASIIENFVAGVHGDRHHTEFEIGEIHVQGWYGEGLPQNDRGFAFSKHLLDCVAAQANGGFRRDTGLNVGQVALIGGGTFIIQEPAPFAVFLTDD